MDAIERIRAERLVAVLRKVPDVERVVGALAAAGIGVVEVTLDSDDALDTIAALRRRGDVTVLAGTVRTVADVESSLAAGAEACVGPVFSEPVVRRCVALDVPAIPGALTPSEVEAAWRAGATMVKVFPASLGGPRYVAEVLAPLSDIPLLVTGGIDASNVAEFLLAGAAAVGVGSALTRADDVGAEAECVLDAVRAV